ncbi:MAG: hypothetical protein GY940_18530, partial [bacterium]|nr:hypothetical protein [bacterium]
LTPMMIIGYHKDRLYFGMNDVYEITVSDMKGRIENTFGIIREKRSISTKVIEDQLVEDAKNKAPVELLRRIAKLLPNKLTHFNRIQVHNGLIYVFTSYYIWNNIQQIDVFSPKGKFLYRGFIQLPEEYKFTSSQGLTVHKGFLYAALENEEGNIVVGKFKMEMPGS